MPDTTQLLLFMGLSSVDKNLVDFMAQNQIHLKQELSLGDDEYRAYIELPKDGFSIIFTDASYFLGKGDSVIGKGDLFYSGIFFHSEGRDGYSEYKADLPFGLLFSDTRPDVLKKLGVQSWQRLAKDGVRVISDRWDRLPDVLYRLHVTYDKETGKISIISASIPDQLLS